MKTTIKTNVASFDKVLGYCDTLGSRYRPVKESINPSNLREMLQRAHQSMELVNVWWEANTSAISERAHVHRQLPVLATRVMNSLIIAGAPQHLIDDVRRIKRKLYYRTSGKNVSQAPSESNEQRKGNPAAQLDYLSKAEVFEKFMQLLKSFPGYATNEADLTIESLEKHLAFVKRLSDNVRATGIHLATARSNRNELVKKMINEAGDVKRYVRAAFGHASNEYNFLSKIRFY